MSSVWSWLCRIRYRPAWLLALAFLLLLLLFLLGRWLFLAYLALLAVLGAIAGMRILLGIIAKICWKATADPKGQGSEGHPPSKGVKLPGTIYKRPDPFLYSQSWLMSLGLAITWDNPDIDLFDPADPSPSPAPVPSHKLKPSTAYTVQARIWNNSLEAPAVNLLVRFYYLSFGIGTVRNYIGETHINLGVKGSSHSPALAKIGWMTPASAGHYCLQAEIVWDDDANPLNNLGQKNVDVKKLNSPDATFTFPLRNISADDRKIALTADAYSIPALPACKPAETQRPSRDVGQGRLAPHRRGAHPVPEGWLIDFHGAEHLELRAGEEKMVTVKITATDAFVPMQAININGVAGGDLVGGVTLYVHN